jgi:hypothetical protein
MVEAKECLELDQVAQPGKNLLCASDIPIRVYTTLADGLIERNPGAHARP